MKNGLLQPGAFLFGFALVVFGLAAFALIQILPPADVPGGNEQNAQLLGRIGGGMIGVGVFAMIYGIVRRLRR